MDTRVASQHALAQPLTCERLKRHPPSMLNSHHPERYKQKNMKKMEYKRINAFKSGSEPFIKDDA